MILYRKMKNYVLKNYFLSLMNVALNKKNTNRIFDTIANLLKAKTTT
jgi:hypothetical protein